MQVDLIASPGACARRQPFDWGSHPHNAGKLSRGEAFHDAHHNEVDSTRSAGCPRIIICGHGDRATGPRFDYGQFHHNSTGLISFRLFHFRFDQPGRDDRHFSSAGGPLESEHGDAAAKRGGYDDAAALDNAAQRYADGSNVANDNIPDAWQRPQQRHDAGREQQRNDEFPEFARFANAPEPRAGVAVARGDDSSAILDGSGRERTSAAVKGAPGEVLLEEDDAVARGSAAAPGEGVLADGPGEPGEDLLSLAALLKTGGLRAVQVLMDPDLGEALVS
jgi:hypothetical protein